VKKTLYRRALRSWFSLLAVSASLALPGLARADSPNLSVEIATGALFLGDGPTPLELGLSIDLSLSVIVADYFLARAAVGFAPVADRHGVQNFARPRLEGALRLPIVTVIPTLGAGAFALGRSPGVYGLAGVAVQLSPTWQLGLDVRSGLFWDQLALHRGSTPFGEAQLRVAWALM
jgi:hypothetical protein